MATRKYKVYKLQVSYDNGGNWEDVLPVQTVKMPVYGETCTVPYAARVWSGIYHNSYKPYGFERKLPHMDILTKEAVTSLTDGTSSIYPGLFIGSSVTEVGSSAFTDYRGYGETVHFEEPSSVRTIRSYAFFKHPYREVIKIPDSVETIEDYAFSTSGYTSLRRVEIGSGCTYIGSSAFGDIAGRNPGNDKGRMFVMKGSTPPQLGTKPFSNQNGESGYVVIVPDNSLSSYRSAWESMSGNVITDTALGSVAKAETNMCEFEGNNYYSAVQQFPNDGGTTLSYSDLTGGTSCWFITWLKIGDSVKSIPDNAFDAYGTNPNLTYLNLGNGVETIGDSAFGSQTYITDLNIPDSVTTIGNGAFRWCENLKTVKIGSGCTTIGIDAFAGCGLISVELGNNIENIGDGAFSSNTLRVDDSFKLPKSLKHLGANAFHLLNHAMMKQLVTPPNIETFGDNALESFSPDILQICGNPSEIGSGMCSQRVAVAIASVTPPTIMDSSVSDNIDKIDWLKASLIYVPDDVINTYETTYGWDYLKDHIYPLSEIGNILNFAGNHKFCGLYKKSYYQYEGIIEFGEYDGNTTLTTGDTMLYNMPPKILWVGDNVQYVDKNVVSYGTLDTEVIIFGTGIRSFYLNNRNGLKPITYVFKTLTPPELDCSAISASTASSFFTESIFYVPDSAVETYRNWLKVNGIITYRKGQRDEGCCNGDYIPTDDYNVRPVSEFCKLSDDMKKRWVEIPGQYECSGSTKMTKEKEQITTDFISWTDTGITRIGKKLLEYFSYDCGYIPYSGKFRGTLSGGTTVELNCNGSSALTRNEISGMMTTYTVELVEIGACVDTIGDETFYYYDSIKVVTIPDNVTSIGDSAFAGCSGLTSCAIGSGVTSIGEYAFDHCSSITSISIPNSVTSIGNGAFIFCDVLSSIDIPDSVTSIGLQAFYTCTSLSSCTIGSGVTSIDYAAFGYCTGLTSIDIPDSVTSIGDSAFLGCTSLSSCTIGSGMTSIDYGAFNSCTSLTSVTVNATTPPTLGRNVFYNTNDCPIYVPAGSLSSYQSAWSDYASRLQVIT